MATPSIKSAIDKILLLLEKPQKLKVLSVTALALVSSVFEMFTASLIIIFAQIINQPESGIHYFSKLGISVDVPPSRIVLYTAMLCGSVFLIKNILSALVIFIQNHSIQNLSYHFKNRLLKLYAESDYSAYLNRNSAYSLSVVSSDAEQIFSTGVLALVAIISETIVFVCLTGLIIVLNPMLAFFIFGLGGVIFFSVSRWLLPAFYNWGKKLQESALYSSQHLLQFFHAFKEIVLLGKTESFIEAFKPYSKLRSKVQAIQASMNEMPRLIIEALFVGLFVVTIAYMCLSYEEPLQMIGMLGGYLYIGFRLMPGLNRIIGQINNFKSIVPCVERVSKECENFSDKDSYENILDFSFEKAIYFNKVHFKYDKLENDVLSNIDLTIYKGETVGIIGETGSGKSTLVDLILGLLKPYQGKISIDGKYNVYAKQWHDIIGYVPQSIYLTDDTIAANIALGEDKKFIDQEKLNKAISAAQLSNFIENLPNGLMTFVGDRGMRLSGGERQRVAIARALYRNPQVIIFDEATSALDNETESRLMQTIYNVSKNRTVIMIAHRLTTLGHCDRIFCIKSGKVIKETTYSEIYENKLSENLLCVESQE
jgi:ABC-type multidrug transport system fused ATPase/permease subunit